YAGKMNFYLSALDDLVKDNTDQASIGLILCKEKDTFTAKYALKDINKPIGVSTYETSNALPENFKSKLPSIEDLERELNDADLGKEE
ncbi:MAG: PDDEXK nuclease domain-containing protein, partial [Bacteroidota bacterium]